MPAGDFEQLWLQNRDRLWRHCRSIAGNPTDADDLFQTVALYAFRGFPTFRRDASFLTWAVRIADRAVIELRDRKARQPVTGTELDQAPASPPPPVTGPERNDVFAAIARAEAARELTATEAAVLTARYRNDGPPDWATVAAALNSNRNHVMVVHCRAIPKFRAWLFAINDPLLGGREAVRQAFERTAPRLTGEEAREFRAVVLGAPAQPVRAVAEFRSACEKVARELEYRPEEPS